MHISTSAQFLPISFLSRSHKPNTQGFCVTLSVSVSRYKSTATHATNKKGSTILGITRGGLILNASEGKSCFRRFFILTLILRIEVSSF